MNTTLSKIDQKTRKIGQIYIWNPMTTELYHVNIDLCHQYGISVAESQTFLRVKRPQRRGETDVFTGYEYVFTMTYNTYTGAILQ